MDDELVGGETHPFDHVGLVDKPQLASGDAVEGEEAGIAMLEPLREPLPLRLVPNDLDGAIPFAEGVEAVFHHPLETCPFDEFAHCSGVGLGGGVVAGRLDDYGELFDGTLPGAENAGVVLLFFLHFFGKGEVVGMVTFDRGLEEICQPLWGEARCNCIGPKGADSGQSRRGIFACERFSANRLIVCVIQGYVGHYHTPGLRLKPAVQRSGRASSAASLPFTGV